MRSIPLSIGTLHFVGIGGIGMSGIAEVMHNLGYSVQGSDLADNANVARIRALGIPVTIGHRPENLGDAQVLVVSSAIDKANPEVVEARSRMIPVVRRAEMLGELMHLKWSIAIAGTHGKTTTTSMVASLLTAAAMDPTVINGGIINAYGTNAHLGKGDWMVVETDESDGSFVKLPATIAVVTNIDPEHMEHYGSFDAVREAYFNFVEKIPFYGFATLCLDHPEVQSLIAKVSDRRIITYGFSPQAEIRGLNLRPNGGGVTFDVAIVDRVDAESRRLSDLRLPMLGAHNVQNALVVVAVAQELGIPDEILRRALAEFSGVRRRFTKVGVACGITVIDDYGHHPVEISAVLSAARSATSGKVVAVVQPHRYSRLADLFEDFCTCFNEADVVVVSPVYAAGEKPIEGIDRDALIAGLRSHGHRRVVPMDDPAELPRIVLENAVAGDLVVCLGAGSITNWANVLPAELERLEAAMSPKAGSAGRGA